MRPQWRDLRPTILSYFDSPNANESMVPDDVEEYREWAVVEAPNFQRWGREMLAAIDYMLTHPEFSISDFIGALDVSRPEPEMRRALEIAREVAFPDAPPVPIPEALMLDPSGLFDRTPERVGSDPQRPKRQDFAFPIRGLIEPLPDEALPATPADYLARWDKEAGHPMGVTALWREQLARRRPYVLPVIDYALTHPELALTPLLTLQRARWSEDELRVILRLLRDWGYPDAGPVPVPETATLDVSRLK